MIRKTILAAAAAASLMTLGGVAQAQITVTFGPPAPRHEVIPAPREGQVWVPGHYEYRSGNYVWVSGHWVAERPGYAFVAPRWEQRGDRWVLVGNTWARDDSRDQMREARRAYRPNGDLDNDGIRNKHDRDIDGDGILNAHDNRPYEYDRPVARRNGPNGDLDGDGVLNRNDRDRDGDGVANWNDRYPNDRRYS